MNVQAFLDSLRPRLLTSSGSAVPDADLKKYISDAVRIYSRYRSLKKRFGDATLYTNAASGDSHILVTGKYFSIGDEIILDSSTPWEEVVTVSSVERVDPATQTGLIGKYYKVNLLANVASDHYAGACVTPNNNSFGLKLSPGVSRYAMPTDFMDLEIDSWSRAIGERRSRKQQASFYDGVYAFSNRTSGVDVGMAQNFFAGGSSFTGLVGSSIVNGALMLPNQGSVGYQILGGDYRFMELSPTPMSESTFTFEYWALHTAETIPDEDADAIIEVTQYTALMTRASDASKMLDFKQGDITMNWARTAEALTLQAQPHWNNFNRAIRSKPFAVSG